MSERDCFNCKYSGLSIHDQPCSACCDPRHTVFTHWEPKEDPKVIRGYCDVCNEWATAGDLIPCVHNEDQSPPMTCGLLKPHQVVQVDRVEDTLDRREPTYFQPPEWAERPVTFEDAKRRLIDQSRQAEPPMWVEAMPRSWEEMELEAINESLELKAFITENFPKQEPLMWAESMPEMYGDDPWAPEDAEYLEEEAPEDTDGDYGWPEAEAKIASDGGSTSYYDLPQDATELNDLVEAKGMGFARGNIFKACYRLGEKAGTDIEYDIKKVIYFAERMLMAHQKGQHV